MNRHESTPKDNVLLHFNLRWILAALGLITCLAAAGCASRDGAAGLPATPAQAPGRTVPLTLPASAPVAAPLLPAPKSLPTQQAPRQSSFLQYLKNGEEFEPLLPSSLVAIEDTRAKFSPAPGGGGLIGSAYCIYRFNLPGYSHNAEIQAAWETLTDTGTTWLALANWTSNRWDWYRGDAEPRMSLASIDPYLRDSGELLVLVLSAGSASQSLSSLRIGTQPPYVSVEFSPEVAFVPVQMTADASGSSDEDGSIVKYEWDFNGNGLYEQDSGAVPSASHTFTTGGAKQVTVRITDDTGVSSTSTGKFMACAEWIHSYGGSGSDIISAVAADGFGNIYAAGSTDSFGGSGTDILLLKYDLAGKLIWARGWDGTGEDIVHQIAINAFGDIVVSGQATGGSVNFQNLLLQVWTPDGELITSRYFDNTAQFIGNTMALAGSSVYLCGYFDGFHNIGLMHYDLTDGFQGATIWTYDGSTQFIVSAMALRAGPATNITLTVAGAVQLAPRQALIAQFSGTGGIGGELNYSSGWLLDGPFALAGSVVDRGIDISELVVSGQVDNQNGGVSAFVSSIDPLAGVNSVWNLDGLNTDINGMLLRPDGGFMLSGFSSSAGRVGLSFGFSPAGANDASEVLANSGLEFTFRAHPRLLLGTGVVIGGNCTYAAGSAFAAASGTPADIPLAWNPVALSPGLSPLLSHIDLPGTVSAPTGAVIDAGGGGVIGDALVICRPF